MEEKELKTSTKQRVFIILIAVLMVGSIIASYAAIVISGSSGSSSSSSSVDEEKIAEIEAEMTEVSEEIGEASKDDFNKFISHKSEMATAYNETSANESGVQTRDVEKGTGDAVTEDNYLAYYIGWCADETVFDSVFDDADDPTSFVNVISPSSDMIEGWTKGVEGMKIGGIREVTIPSELAYKDTSAADNACGANKPLKFLIMAIAKEGEIAEISDEMMLLQTKIVYANYGIDYDSISGYSE